MYDANYWNNKWSKAPIVYSGRALRGKSQRIAVDVKNFITKNDELLNRTIERFNLRQNTANETAHKIQKFVVNHFTYKYDKEQNVCPEFWQFPFESLQSKIGDCEDGAILIAGLMRHAGIPAYRVKVAAGEVQTAPTAPTGGHAYCIYLADKEADGKEQNWVILDWCIADNKRTLIQTPTGSKRISKLEVGEWIVGYDETKKIPALTQIKKINNRWAKNLFKVDFENSNYIIVTGEHPFYVDDKWVRADELQKGMEVYWAKPQNLFHQFHNHKRDPWRKKAAIKAAKTKKTNGDYERLSERQTKNNTFTWPSVKKKLSINNAMKRPEVAEKSFSTRVNGKKSKPEINFIDYCKEHKLPVKYVGDGKLWVRTSDGSKNPDFHIPGTKKLIEVSSKQFEYYRNWNDYKSKRKRLLAEKSYEVEFVLYNRNNFDESVDKEKLHSFILNGNKITKITKLDKRSKYKSGTTVWNMQCEPHNNYFVNGNLVHNCFFEDSNLPISGKPLAKEGGYKSAYKDVWFTFNDEFSWNQNSLRINAERISNNRTRKLEESLDYKVIDADRTIDNIVKSL